MHISNPIANPTAGGRAEKTFLTADSKSAKLVFGSAGNRRTNGSLFSPEVPIEISSSPVSRAARTAKAASSTVKGETLLERSRMDNCRRAVRAASGRVTEWTASTMRVPSMGRAKSVVRDWVVMERSLVSQRLRRAAMMSWVAIVVLEQTEGEGEG